MGKILTTFKSPVRDFNLESRAHKIISQPKPTPAPKHEKDQIDYEKFIKDYPHIYKESLKKNEQLDKHLKNVYVTSKDFSTKPDANPSRPLPVNRNQTEEFEYGTKEPDKIPLGKTTLRIALEFITKHQSNPQEFSVNKIAELHSLSEEKVGDILKHFKVFEVYIPKEKKPKAWFAGPSLPRMEIKKRLPKLFPIDKET